jgi:hypothetical protein
MDSFVLVARGKPQNLCIFNPAYLPAESIESIRDLSILILAIAGFIFVAVEGLQHSVIGHFRWVLIGGTQLFKAKRWGNCHSLPHGVLNLACSETVAGHKFYLTIRGGRNQQRRSDNLPTHMCCIENDDRHD